MKEAIQKAVEGGWKPVGYGEFSDNAISYKVQAVMKIKYKERIFLDPLFWQCLGKSLRWTEYPTERDVIGNDWRDYWHSFIDHLASGKEAEEFFTNLLK